MLVTLEEKYIFEEWQPIDEEHSAIRFVTSWATEEAHVDELIKAITDAIKNELDKSGKSMSDAKKEQAKKEKENEKRIAEARGGTGDTLFDMITRLIIRSEDGALKLD